MKDVYALLLERNARETTPFQSIHEANSTLWNQVDALQSRLADAEREVVTLRRALEGSTEKISGKASSLSSNAATAAIRNEARLRDKLDKLQEEFNAKLKAEAIDKEEALKTARELSGLKDLSASQQKTLASIQEENERFERGLEHRKKELEEAQSRTELAEKQYEGLKGTIRGLQEENDKLEKDNMELEKRLLADKGKTVNSVVEMTDLVEALKKENEMLKSLIKQEDKRSKGWFGSSLLSTSSSPKKKEAEKDTPSRKFGDLKVVLPSAPKQTIPAHTSEGMCLRYDSTGNDLLATSGGDSVVKIWDTASGTVRATLRGSTGHAMTACDLSGTIAVGAGSDKTCRVWNIRTERMIHHLVGHQHKITCARLFGGEKGVITGSADRSLKVWDISRQTYKQTVTLRHSSTSYCLGIGSDSSSAVSGHMDGGVRFWDLRTGDRTADISGLHQAGVTSVQFNPLQPTQILTNGLDSMLCIVDVRTGLAIHKLRDPAFSTGQAWSDCVYSPDGQYAAAGSNASGTIFFWRTADGSLKKKLQTDQAGICALDWSRGGNSGQQVSSLDRKGNLVLWA